MVGLYVNRSTIHIQRIDFLDYTLRGEALLYERQRYDGWYNNMAHPEWGAVGKYRLDSISIANKHIHN